MLMLTESYYSMLKTEDIFCFNFLSPGFFKIKDLIIIIHILHRNGLYGLFYFEEVVLGVNLGVRL